MDTNTDAPMTEHDVRAFLQEVDAEPIIVPTIEGTYSDELDRLESRTAEAMARLIAEDPEHENRLSDPEVALIRTDAGTLDVVALADAENTAGGVRMLGTAEFVDNSRPRDVLRALAESAFDASTEAHDGYDCAPAESVTLRDVLILQPLREWRGARIDEWQVRGVRALRLAPGADASFAILGQRDRINGSDFVDCAIDDPRAVAVVVPFTAECATLQTDLIARVNSETMRTEADDSEYCRARYVEFKRDRVARSRAVVRIVGAGCYSADNEVAIRLDAPIDGTACDSVDGILSDAILYDRALADAQSKEQADRWIDDGARFDVPRALDDRFDFDAAELAIELHEMPDDAFPHLDKLSARDWMERTAAGAIFLAGISADDANHDAAEYAWDDAAVSFDAVDLMRLAIESGELRTIGLGGARVRDILPRAEWRSATIESVASAIEARAGRAPDVDFDTKSRDTIEAIANAFRALADRDEPTGRLAF